MLYSLKSHGQFFLLYAAFFLFSACGPTAEQKCINNCETQGYICLAVLNSETDLSATSAWVLCNQNACYEACHARADAYRARQESKNKQ
jgi:hypothetical protein